MRASSLLGIVAFVVVGSSSTFAESPAIDGDINAVCRIPFEQLMDPKSGEFFPRSAAINENVKLSAVRRQRYVVADLNSADEDGKCRGVEEHFTPVSDLTDFPRLRALAASLDVDIATLAKETVASLIARETTPGDAADLATELDDLKNYLAQVDRYKTNPVVKARVFNGYCVGQTLNLCEVVNGEPKLVYRFVTSSSRYTPPVYRYYAPINIIKSRSWSADRPYTPADNSRDARMGGGFSRVVPFANGGRPIDMPNFLHFLPMQGYPGETQNGIHEIAGGLDSGGTFGAPVSLGCIRLNKFQAKLARWWIPTQAKFFIHFDPNRYRQTGDSVTARARGFQAPGEVSFARASASRRSDDRSEPERPKPDTQASAVSVSGSSLLSASF